MIIVTYRKLFFAIAAVMLCASVAAIAVFGIQLGIDFTGGTLTEVRYGQERPDIASVEAEIANLGIVGASVRPSDDDLYLVRTRTLSEEERIAFTEALVDTPVGTTTGTTTPAAAQIESFTEIGPTIGSELRVKAVIALTIVILAIVLYVAFVFRHVSKPVSSWAYGGITIFALVHDILIPAGALAVMGYLFGIQADALFVTALLAILGYSVHDTIVTFDRVRENLRLNEARSIKEDFELTVGRSVNQTLVRSINTSITTLAALVALYFLGPASTEHFTLILIIGILAGTYSSIFLAAPLLVAVERRKAKK
jgi:preprotein translocase subunit SecF